MDQTSVTLVNQLTLAAAAIIACGVLWRAYSKRVEEHITDLREMNKSEIADLRARLMVIEDSLHIQRSERMKYLPTLEYPTKGEMKGIDE